MKNAMLIIISIFLVMNANALQFKGKIVIFSGNLIETGRPYSYPGLLTANGLKLRLPDWINGKSVATKYKNNQATFEAEIERVFCTDMSDACLNGALVDVKSAEIVLTQATNRAFSFSGKLIKHSGIAVESHKRYNYISIGSQNIEVPSFLDASALLEENAELRVVGTPKYEACTDMSAACGPTKLYDLKKVNIKF